ncbi:response regulator [Sandaracinus amylolyticus]|uniref:response regulator n=1 Tax=Sandaracinus amylolyticus TaxID=927083 RepID=UPI001F02D5C0|nr:response regulator [Sandaracinus amylolyticus]UJR79123.1 Phosphate regulon transcriptional regulatory protein PhoB [Sandaracinus amylolyticus]
MAGPGDKKQLGKILLKQKLVTPGELDDLLDQQRRSPGTRLASAAMRSGKLEEVDLLRALSEQHGVPGIDLSQVVVPTQNLRLVPIDVARQSLILPFSVKDEEIFLAMADPDDRRVIDEIEFVTGRTVHPYVALHDHLAEVIDAAYQQLDRGEPHYVGPNAPAEYLESLGIRSAAPPPLRARARAVIGSDDLDAQATPPGVPPPRRITNAGTRPGTQPGTRPTERRLPTLDPVFDSRVGPLPKEEIASALRAPDRVKRVLVVDDEDDIRRMLRRVLQERGYQVLEAAKGSDALQMVREHVPDLILLDAMLPEIHGFDICRRIKGSQKYGHIPIIMLSAIYRGWRFAEDLRESYGVQVFLEKPFKISDVTQAIERALEGHTGERDEDEELSSQASDALTSGIEAYKAGNIDDAIAHLRRGVGIDPLSFRLHYHLGLLYGRRDNLFEAIHEMETAVDLAPRNFAALKNLAVLYQRAGFKHRAIEIWERAIGSAPDEETKRGIKEHLMSLL